MDLRKRHCLMLNATTGTAVTTRFTSEALTEAM